MVDAKDIKFQQYDGRTLLDINDGGFVGIANGATGPGTIRVFEDTDNGSNYIGLAAGSISSSFTLTLPTADGSAGQILKTNGSGALSFATGIAADNLSAGDAAVTLSTVAGNITIDATANDTDIIFKGTDNSADITMLTLDGSDAGSATFNHDIILGNDSFVRFGDAGEKITGDGTDLTINSSNDLHLTATTDINIPANVGLTFGDDAEKIEGDGTDLTISGNNIKLTAATDVIIPTNVGLHFTDANEKIESDGSNIKITSGGTEFTIPSSDGSNGQFLKTNGSGVLSFGSVSSAADDISTGDAAVTIATSSGDITLDSPADIILDAAGNDFNFKAGGTEVLRVTNSSSDVIIKPIVDAKDLIFQQRDGTEVMRIEDGAHVAFTAAALNPEATLSDGANVAWNTLTSPVAKVTLAGNRNLSAGSGGVAGAFQSLLVIQDGTGSRTLSFNAVYEFKDDTAPTLTSTANKGDLFVFRYNGSKFLEVGRNQNLTLS
jgi:hypothetical protein